MSMQSHVAGVPVAGNLQGRARLRSLSFALALLLSLAVVPASQGELLDRIIATVNNEVVTASELDFAIAFNQRLGASNKDRNTLKEGTLDGLITRRLLVQEAHRLRFVEVSAQELAAAMAKLRERFASEREYADFLAASDVSAQELSRMVGEQLLVERFVEKKVGLFVRVSREEAEAYFNEHATEFKGKHFQDVQKTILAAMTERRLDQQLNLYLAELRGKADIRVNAR